MKVALSGASGFVANELKKIYPNNISINRNDTTVEIKEKLQDVDVVINLAGAPIIKRWSEKYKKVLYSSRIDTTKKLVEAINQSDVKHFISTSAIGIYPSNIACDEHCSYGTDFLSKLTQAWEEEAKKCTKVTTILRFGIVLGANAGALKQMLPAFKLGVGGTIGSGKMIMSWIDIDDLTQMYKFIIDNGLKGTFNATSPNPVTNYEFTKTLGKVLNRPTIFPLPEFVLKLIFGEGSSVITDSKEIYPKEIEQVGFTFLYPNIEASLKHLLKY